MENGLTNVKIMQNGQGAFSVAAIDILRKSIFVLKMSVPKAPIHVHILLSALYAVEHIGRSTRTAR